MNNEEVYKAIETARSTGKIAKGCNEVTKALERGTAKLVVVAKDTEPKEILMHLPVLAQEKGVPFVEIPSREELGAAAGLHVKAACVAITKEGESKKIIANLAKAVEKEAEPEEKKEAPEQKEEAKPEEKPEEKSE